MIVNGHLDFNYPFVSVLLCFYARIMNWEMEVPPGVQFFFQRENGRGENSVPEYVLIGLCPCQKLITTSIFSTFGKVQT
jgi:hypothetical protein